MNILLVEDNKELADFLKFILESKDNKVIVCNSVEKVIKNGYQKTPHDLVILDLILKGKGGEALISEFKKNTYKIPIFVLSALSDLKTKIEVMNLGADDYLTKPFDTEELLARLKALFRSYKHLKSPEVEKFKELSYYRKERGVERNGKRISLTPKENEIFEMLLRNKGKTVPKEDLLNLWNTKPGYHSNIVSSLMRRLRKKIDGDFSEKLIINNHGIGYSINVASH